MSFYEEHLIKDLEERSRIKESGGYNGIPFTYPRYREYFPSIEKGMFMGLVAGTGVGKSRFTRYTFIYEPVRFAMATGYPLKILYLSLEDSKLSVYKRMTNHYLWERHNLDLPTKVLNSIEEPIPQRYLELLKKDVLFFKEFEQMVYVVDDYTQASKIVDISKRFIDRFPEHHVLIILDNSANVTKDDSDSNEWEAVRNLVREDMRLGLCKQRNASIVYIMQTDNDTEKVTARQANSLPISAVEPNLASLGDVKVINRSFHVLWALFNPWRYEIKQYPYSPGYNIDILRNKFRSLLMLKANESEIAPRLPLLFNGLRETFTEMPSLDDVDALDKIYKDINLNLLNKRQNLIKRTTLF